MPHPKARLILAGRGADELGSSDPRIDIRNKMPAGEFCHLLASSDVVVMPSSQETLGLIAQEAMLLKRLLLAVGLGEFMDEECAILVQPKSVQSLRAGLERALSVLSEPDLYGRYVDRAFERVQAFRPTRLVRELEDCYDTCMQTARSGQARAQIQGDRS